MLPIIRAIILFVIITVSGCAPTTHTKPVTQPTPEMPGYRAFQKAERAFDSGQYTEALDGYNTVLREAYDAPFVDAALFKIGKVFLLTGRNEDAMDVFWRLKHEFPRSAFVPQAMLDVMKVLYDGGHFQSVISLGLAQIETPDPRVPVSLYDSIIADAYEAIGSHLESARYHYRAWVAASDEEKENAWSRLKQSVEQLSADDIQELVTQVTDPDTMGFLLYRLGMAFILEEKYDEAMDVLDTFVGQFPEHPDHQDASDMLQSLKARSRFTPFTIGCVLPLSGSYALFGRRALDGVELALSQFGQTGGSVPFNIIVKDSRSDPGATETAMEELDRSRVGFILGPMSVSEAAATSAQKRGIPIIVFTQKEGVTDIGPYVFRNFITPQMQVRSLVSFAVQELGVDRFAILYPDEHYGRRYMNLFWDQVLEEGRVVNGVEAYDPQATDFAKPIKKLAGIFYKIPKDLMAASLPSPTPLTFSLQTDVPFPLRPDSVEALTGIPLDRDAIDALGRRNSDNDDQWHPIVDFDAIFIPDAPKKAGLVIPQLAFYDIRDVYLLGTNLWNSQALLKMSGEYMKNTLITDGFFARSESPVVQQFVAAFRSVYGRVPGIVEAVAYDSAMMVFQTMRRTATDSRREIKDALLQSVDYHGVSGRTRFAQNGEAIKTMHMLRIERGHFVEVQHILDPKPPMQVDGFPDD